ncbi:hypothetical protein C4587_01485 [Candidatus Parcubacteria bacterium]|nr:MAG: hypothetical protein C4587_01485 [Candidatus Parcubacteria bacterium]
MWRPINRFFDKLEDKIRGWFSHKPILYGFVGGVGTVLFWRGVWHTADFISATLLSWQAGGTSGPGMIAPAEIFDGPLSLLIGTLMLLATGIFVSGFIGNEIIISGLRGEKKLAEKTEAEVKTETGAIAHIHEEVVKISKRLEGIEKRMGK